MAYYNNLDISPDKDTGWGLIFRLNDILKEIENYSSQGRYDMWNYKLDRIWVNLCYREEMDVVKDDDGEITEIKLKDSDIKEKKFIDEMILQTKIKMKEAMIKFPEDFKMRKEYIRAKAELYEAMTVKDAWIRKLMHRNKLYIHEKKKNPGSAMFGRDES